MDTLLFLNSCRPTDVGWYPAGPTSGPAAVRRATRNHNLVTTPDIRSGAGPGGALHDSWDGPDPIR